MIRIVRERELLLETQMRVDIGAVYGLDSWEENGDRLIAAVGSDNLVAILRWNGTSLTEETTYESILHGNMMFKEVHKCLSVI